MKTSPPIRVELEPTNHPGAERAVLDVFKLLLKDLEENPVDNPVDGSQQTRY